MMCYSCKEKFGGQTVDLSEAPDRWQASCAYRWSTDQWMASWFVLHVAMIDQDAFFDTKVACRKLRFGLQSSDHRAE
jgi:hypothetical protein